LAVTVLLAFMLIIIGPAAPLPSPLHPLNVYPAFAPAFNGRFCPLSYQYIPGEGLIVPPPSGITEIVKLYWVVKLAM
jgi:hypothetical protein